MSHAFWSLLAVPIGGPILLVLIIWVLAGFRKNPKFHVSMRSRLPARAESTSPQFHNGPKPSPVEERNATPPRDLTKVGRALAKLLMDPDDCWRHVCMLRQYKVPDAVATCEMAFARAAITRDAISRSQTSLVATQMLAGVDSYVADAFANEESAETLEYYGDKPLSVVAPQAIRLYEENAFYLPQLADVLASRLSVPGLPAIEIAPLFEEVAAEAERLMRLSSVLQKSARNATTEDGEPSQASRGDAPTSMDAVIRLTYGSSPPQKTAALADAIVLAHETLLRNSVNIAEVRTIATQLYNGPMPYSTHELAMATALNLFKNAVGARQEKLMQVQISARMIGVDWVKNNKVVPLLAKTFEDTLYEKYKLKI